MRLTSRRRVPHVPSFLPLLGFCKWSYSYLLQRGSPPSNDTNSAISFNIIYSQSPSITSCGVDHTPGTQNTEQQSRCSTRSRLYDHNIPPIMKPLLVGLALPQYGMRPPTISVKPFRNTVHGGITVEFNLDALQQRQFVEEPSDEELVAQITQA